MASASVSSLVIFIAAVSIAAAVSGTMVSTVGGIANSLEERGADVASDVDTDVEIISDPSSGAVYDDANSSIRVLVKNTGRRTIATDGSAVEVLVDGQYVPRAAYTVAVLDDSSWHEGSVVRIAIDKPLSGGDHRVTTIVGSERETLRFRT